MKVLTIDWENGKKSQGPRPRKWLARRKKENCRKEPTQPVFVTFCTPVRPIKWSNINVFMPMLAWKSLINNEIANKLHTHKHLLRKAAKVEVRFIRQRWQTSSQAAWLTALYDLPMLIHSQFTFTFPRRRDVVLAHITDDGCLAACLSHNFSQDVWSYSTKNWIATEKKTWQKGKKSFPSNFKWINLNPISLSKISKLSLIQQTFS